MDTDELEWINECKDGEMNRWIGEKKNEWTDV